MKAECSACHNHAAAPVLSPAGWVWLCRQCSGKVRQYTI